MHIHHREDESFYVLDGALIVRCGEERYDAPTGSYILLPRGIPHTFRVVSETPARLLTLLTPGGGEGVFVAGGRPAERMPMPPAAPVDIPKLRQAALQFGSEIVGPPLSARSETKRYARTEVRGLFAQSD